MFLLVGLCLIPSASTFLALTFTNADTDYWCKRPSYLSHLTNAEWIQVSGQNESRCQVFDADYNVFRGASFEFVKAKL